MLSLKRKILTQGGVSGCYRAFSLLCGFATAILLARTLGASGLGIYASALAVLTIFSLPLEFGLPSLVTREIAKSYHQGSYQETSGVMLFGLLFVLVAFPLIALGTLIVIPLTPWGIHISGEELWWLIVFYICFTGITSVINACLAGAHFLIASQFSTMVLKPLLSFVSLLVVTFQASDSLSPLTVLWIQTWSLMVAMLVSILILARTVLPRLFKQKPIYKIKVWLSSAWKLGLVNAIRRTHPQLLLFLLSLMASPEAVGFFRVCQRGASLVSFGTSLVITVASPYMATFFASQELARLQRLLKRSTQIMTTWAFVLLLVLMIWGKQILLIVFGAEYVASYTILMIFCFVELFTAYFGMSIIMLNMTGNETVSARIISFGLIPSLFGALIFVPYSGALGAALAYALSTMLVYSYASIEAWRISRIDTSLYLPFLRET